ncbi:MAG: protein-L-isoaspartate O-methyltransferase [Nitrososphaerales archaeon]
MSNGLHRPRIELIDSLKREGVLKSKQVECALLAIDRADFLWKDESIGFAYSDAPLSLGETGQTMSAPHMVVIMLEEAEIQHGLKVLEVGAGSGYNAALIAKLVNATKDNPVISIERNEELASFARTNLDRVGVQASVIEGDGSLGYPKGSHEMIYDRIIVTAASPVVPPDLLEQLKVGGILLIPLGRDLQTLVKIRKEEDALGKIKYSEERLMAVAFVPLIGEGSSA